MKKSLITIIFITAASTLLSQFEDRFHYLCVGDPLDYENVVEKLDTLFSKLDHIPDSEKMHDYTSRINARYDFHTTMKTIRNPSTISSFTNWKIYRRGDERKPYIMEADINFPITIPGMGKWVYSTFHLVPRFRYRIFRNDNRFNDKSNPVRTPSAIPGLAWYFTPHPWWENKAGPKLTRQKYFGLYVFHHSNGQDGDELLKNRINTRNGNFGEQLVIEFTIGGKQENYREKPHSIAAKRRKHNNSIKKKIPSNVIKLRYANSTDYHWRLGYEYHPGFLTNKVLKKSNLYGRYRINLDLNFINYTHMADFITDGYLWCLYRPKYKLERWRHNMELTFIADPVYKRYNDDTMLSSVPIYDISERLNLNYSIYYILPGWKNFACFTQLGYHGSDVYNIFFEESYANFRVGIAFGFFDQPSMFRKINAI